jgi:hypothetical protein
MGRDGLTKAINGQRVKLVDRYPVLELPSIPGQSADEVYEYKALSQGWEWLTFEERRQFVPHDPARNVTKWAIVILPVGSKAVPSPFPGAPAQRIPPGTVMY